MSQMFPQLDAVVVRMTPEARDRHLHAVDEALAGLRPNRSRFRLLAVAVAVLFLLPVLALAARNADPGDFLYPVRQILPWSDRAPSDAAEIDELPHETDSRSDVRPTADVVSPLVERTDPVADQPAGDEASEPDRRPTDRVPDEEPRSPPEEVRPDERDLRPPDTTVPDTKPQDRRGDRP